MVVSLLRGFSAQFRKVVRLGRVGAPPKGRAGDHPRYLPVLASVHVWFADGSLWFSRGKLYNRATRR
eukprot:11223589-Lingulodinium_polyedra.AAC.1